MIIREYRQKLKEEGKEHTTIRNYISSVKDYREFIRQPLRSATLEDYENYIWRLKENGLSKRTINLKTSRIKDFYEFLKSKETVSQQIDKIIDKPYLEIEKAKRGLFTIRSLDRVLNEGTVKLRTKCLLILMFWGGMNPTELSLLKQNAFIERENYVKARVFNTEKDSRRIIFIPNKYYQYIKDFMKTVDDDNPYLFQSSITGRNLNPQTIKQKVLSTGHSILGYKFSITQIRKGGFNHLYREGLSLFTIAEIMGFKNLRTLWKYIVTDEFSTEKEIGDIIS